ncbi:hypothetical protein [Staphylococcus succinus]|uniref:hypothetical protein n=1 Tax=Staphylococcus succinus TaxID=61015 RepID=UPI000936700A|nr:hypothetical protein [Staphylococcus succinus]
MGLSTEYQLKQSNSSKTIEVIPLSGNNNRVFGLYKNFGLDEYIITNQRLEEITREFKLIRADQTNIFDYL